MARTLRRAMAATALAVVPLTAIAANEQGVDVRGLVDEVGASIAADVNQAVDEARGRLDESRFSTDGQVDPGDSSADQRFNPGDGTQGRSSSVAPNVSGQRIGSYPGAVMIATRTPTGAGAGSGIVWKSDGTVLTNYHVVAGSTAVRVTASGGKTYPATVVGFDQRKDIAVLKLQGASGLATARFDTTPSTGEAVSAIGQGGGLGSLYRATGTVKAQGQSITARDETGSAGEKLSGLLMTDAPIVAGYSGGPLLDGDGEVIGMDTAASGTTPISGFAIPSSRVLSVANDILSGKKTTTNHIGARAAVGVQIVSGTGRFEGGSDRSGAVVSDVVDGFDVNNTTLAPGDVITQLGTAPIASVSDLTTALNAYSPGDRVSLTWNSVDGSHTATVELGKSETN